MRQSEQSTRVVTYTHTHNSFVSRSLWSSGSKKTQTDRRPQLSTPPNLDPLCSVRHRWLFKHAHVYLPSLKIHNWSLIVHIILDDLYTLPTDDRFASILFYFFKENVIKLLLILKAFFLKFWYFYFYMRLLWDKNYWKLFWKKFILKYSTLSIIRANAGNNGHG